MKLSSYLIIAAAVAQILFSVGAVCFVSIFMRRDIETVDISDKLVTKSVDRFSTVNFSIMNAEKSPMALTGTKLIFAITESDTITAPAIGFSVDLEKVVNLTVVDNTLSVELDFSKLGNDHVTVIAHTCGVLPINLKIPRGMIKSINMGRYGTLSINDMIADRLDIFTSARNTELCNCRITDLYMHKHLNDISLSNGTIIDHFKGNCDSGEYGYGTIVCSSDSRFGDIDIDCDELSSLDLLDANYSSVRLTNTDENISVNLNSDVIIKKAE